MIRTHTTILFIGWFLIFPFDLFAQTDGLYIAKFLFEFGNVEEDEYQLALPEALSIDIKGNIFIMDSDNNRIVKVDKNGRYLEAVGGFGWQPEQFDHPLDISVLSILDVFVADFNNQRIERYDKDLNYISSLTRKENDIYELDFGFPSSVALSKHGELFIADTENDRILKLDSFGEPILVFGDFSWGEGKLSKPRKLEITDNDLIYVSDYIANDIVVFDYYGNFIHRFGANYLNKPDGLAWWQNFLLIADSGNHQIVMVGERMVVEFAWGAKGDKYGAFDRPVDVGVFDDNIYVLDSNNNRVQVFELVKN